MLPVSGITELSARPNRIRPTPPRRRSCRQIGTASKGWRWSSIRVSRSLQGMHWIALNHIALRHIELNNCGIRGQKTNLWRRRQCPDLRRIAIEKLQTFEAERVQVVINIFGEVGAHLGLVESQAWRPLAGDLIEACGLKSVVAGLLKDCRQVLRRGPLPQGI